MKPQSSLLLSLTLLSVIACGAGGADQARTAASLAGAANVAPATLRPYLEKYCYECHDGDVTKGGLDLGTLPYGEEPAVHVRWVRVFDRITAGEMPPEKKPRPEESASRAFLAALGKDLTAQHLAIRGTVLRRLNRIEYRNTVEDLLGMHLGMYEDLPEDARSHGFDTIGEALGMSDVHLRRYLAAADVALSGIELRSSAPQSTVRHLDIGDSGGGKRALSEHMWLAKDGATVVFTSGQFPSTILDNLTITDGGLYTIRLALAAVQAKEPISVALYVGNFRNGGENEMLGYYDVIPGTPSTIEVRTWLRAGDTIRPMVSRLVLPPDAKKDIAAYQGPGLAFQPITIEGPLLEQWPSRGQRLLFGDVPLKDAPAPKGKGKAPPPEPISLAPERDGARLLLGFATAAFRRPVLDAQVAPYVSLFRDELAKKATFQQAMQTAAGAILCAPDFLYLIEHTRAPGTLLDDYDLASRLAYFLTRTMPDDDLLHAAADGRLRTPAGLTAQTERLLNSPAAKRFITDFTDGWLNLREITATTPDQKLYPEFDDQLQFAMVDETRSFVNELITRDLPCSNLVFSDFAMLNERLARQYGIPGVTGTAIRLVKLPVDSHRGGLLTQASILKVSANGTSTSPVIRGVYVMDRLLGFQPPPPPPGVAGLEPDTRGATTVREQLSKHRHLESCNGCHRIIDPPGFALERFDVIGGWRDRVRSLDQGERVKADRDGHRVGYKLGPAVDASGDLVGVGPFHDFEEFRTLLLGQQERITANLAARLLSFGTGRDLGFSDRAVIAALVKQLGPGGGVRALIHLVVHSDAFLSK
jgi:hypothetical protein